MNTAKVENIFGSYLMEQFERKWNMLKEAIENCTEPNWHRGKDEWTYSWIIYHIIETADFYSRNNPEDMVWGRRVDIKWEENSEEEIKRKKTSISKEFLLEYVEEIEQRLSNLFSSNNDEELLKKDDFSWFDSIYEKLLYLLRHNSYHLGELAKDLRDFGCERIKWR